MFAIGLALDLGLKEWCFRTVGPEPVLLDRELLLEYPDYDPVAVGSRRALLPWGLLDVRLVLNPGAVFGLGAHRRAFFIVFTVLALGAGLVAFARFTTRRARLAHVALGLVLAGGLGNLYDRIAFGRVRDFIQVLPGRRLPDDWTWPGTNNPELFPWVFNLADLWLLAGMVLFMAYVNRLERRQVRARELEAQALEPER